MIIGRAGQAILADRPDVLHVRLCAPVKIRAHRIAKQHSITLRGAFAQVRASDNYRRKFLRKYYKIDWNDPTMYHLVINTARISTNQASELILNSLSYLTTLPTNDQQENQLEFKETPT